MLLVSGVLELFTITLELFVVTLVLLLAAPAAGVVESVISCTLLGPFLSELLPLTGVVVDGGIIFLCGVVWSIIVLTGIGLAGGEVSMLTVAVFLVPTGISWLARGIPISPSSNPSIVQ